MHRSEKIEITLVRLMESYDRGRLEKCAGLEEYKLIDAEPSVVREITSTKHNNITTTLHLVLSPRVWS